MDGTQFNNGFPNNGQQEFGQPQQYGQPQPFDNMNNQTFGGQPQSYNQQQFNQQQFGQQQGFSQYEGATSFNTNPNGPMGNPQFDGTMPPPMNYNMQPPKKKSKAPIIVVVIIILIALCCACCIFAIKNGETSFNVTMPGMDETLELENEDDSFTLPDISIDEENYEIEDNDFIIGETQNSDNEEVQENIQEEIVENEIEQPIVENQVSTLNVGYNHETDLNNPTITIDGVTFTFPLNVQDIINAGYVADEEILSQELGADEYTLSEVFENANGKIIYVRCINTKTEPVQFQNAEVYSICVMYDNYNPEKNYVVEIPSGVTLGKTTIEEFDAAFTNPTDSYDSDNLDYGSHDRTFGRDSENYYMTGNSYEYSFWENVLDEIEVTYLP